jgi:hypothetical protein
MQVVEVRMRYDDICIPGVYKDDAITYIKDAKINKTCGSHRLIVSISASFFLYDIIIFKLQFCEVIIENFAD